MFVFLAYYQSIVFFNSELYCTVLYTEVYTIGANAWRHYLKISLNHCIGTVKTSAFSTARVCTLNLRRNSKTWIFRKKRSSKTQIITLGKWPALSCKQARLDARRYADESDISNKTVSDLISEYKKDVVYPDSKVPKQVEGYLNHIDQSFGQFKVMGVKRAQLVYFIKQYSGERGARSADRVRSYLKQVFAYGVELGYLTGSSPMDGVTKRVTGYKHIDRSRVLSNDEIRMVWSWKNPEKGQQNVEDNARGNQVLASNRATYQRGASGLHRR